MDIMLLCDDDLKMELPDNVEKVDLPPSSISYRSVRDTIRLLGRIPFNRLSRFELKRIRHFYRSALSRQSMLADFVKTRNIDIVHCHFLTRPATVAATKAINKIPIITTVHGSDIYVSPSISQVDLNIVKSTIAQSNAIHVCGEKEKLLARKLGAPPCKIFKKPWFFDHREFRPPRDRREVSTVRKTWKIPENAIVLISTRKLENIYDIPHTVKVFKEALRKENRLYLVVGGGGSKYEEIESLISKWRIESRVRMTGDVKPKEIEELLRASDIYIQTPRSDALPYSLLEALSCGLPAVVTDKGSIKEILVENSRGFEDSVCVVAENNSDMMVDAIIAMAKEKRKTFGVAPDPVAKQFGIDQGMKWIESTYSQVIEKFKRER